ncbi:transglycosylase domain-containing protein [Patulibacter sp.]|uniref:transglycosylase domain-containing protein n=1 Tax=Patulibacter sp. TaxID=1912859 RepID=UPI002722EF31|nr:transglycosylase domain-containing protein [Patulibacter sp.]MDO9406871.1 transglycosylase domain-containing protein [Patulibacter sp.]
MIEPSGQPGARPSAARPVPGATAAPPVVDPHAPWWGAGDATAAAPVDPVRRAAAPAAPSTDGGAGVSAVPGPSAGPPAVPVPPAARIPSAPVPGAVALAGGGGGDDGGAGLPPTGGGGSGAGDHGPPRPRLRFRWVRLLLLLVPLGALAVVSTVFGMMMAVSTDLPDLDTAKEFQTAKNSVLMDRNGRPIGVLADSSRYIVASDQISTPMKDAVVAMEDERFYKNSGVDLKGIGRAVVQDVVSQSAAQGASTITQQLVKVSLEAEDQRTVFQKLREAALAYHMTKQWSKAKILTTYLNRIYFGNGAYGVESAARTYFGSAHDGCQPPGDPCAAELTPAEAALLTAVIASPSRFDPLTEPEAALRRRNTVLLKMQQQGKLSQEDYELAKNEPLPTRDQVQPPTLDATNPYFASWVSAQLIDKVGAQRTYEGGLKVTTTLDAGLQKAAEASIKAYLTRPTGPQASMVVIDNKTGEVRAMVGGRDYATKPYNLATQGQRQPGSSFKPFVLTQALREGISPQKVYSSKKQTLNVRDENGRKEKFVVTNDESAYSGRSTISRALTFSDNSVYAQLGQDVGIPKVARLITRMGVRTPVSKNAALALGAPRRGVTVLDLAHAYETFATRGLRINGTLGGPGGGAVGIKEIQEPGRKTRVNKRRAERVISTDVADTATSIMRTVVSKGTGHRAQYGGFAAGKTGTTENNVDAWFAGFSRDLTVVVWVGYPDSGKPMQTEWQGEPVEGGTFPAAIWGDFMGRAKTILDARDPDRDKRTKNDEDLPKEGKEPSVSAAPSGSGGDSGAGDDGDTGSAGTGGATTAEPSTGSGGGSTPDPAPATPATPPSGTGSGSGTGSSGTGGAGGTSGTGSGSGSGAGTGGSAGTGSGSGGAVPLE